MSESLGAWLERTVLWRFDIDTVTCIERGVPNLLALAGERPGLALTFFVNMGRAISRTEVLLRSPARTASNVQGTADKVSAAAKLGVRDCLRTLLLNPPVGAAHEAVLDAVVAAGHELALHGGDNHAVWQRRAHLADAAEVHRWLDETYRRFRARYRRPRGFASPGCNASPVCYAVLAELGFEYVSDATPQGPELGVFEEPGGLLHVPINGQVRQVPLIEHYCARGLDGPAVVAKVLEHIRGLALKTVVAHPVFEGYRRLDLFGEVVERLLAEGYRFATYASLLDRLAGCRA